jgi:hypothetical protein
LHQAKLILIFGSMLALIASLSSAFIPGLAYFSVSGNWSTFFIPDTPHAIVFPAWTFSIHAFTVKLLVTAFGGLLGVLSFFERKRNVPFLSFSGMSLGTIGFLLPAGTPVNLVNVYSVDIPWVGSLIALVGVLMMFLGFAMRNSKVPRKALATVPILLAAYLVVPSLILSGNVSFFIFMQANLSMSTIIGVVILVGHLMVIWAGISGLRFPEIPKN